jgi:hypothetical protein
MDNRYRRQVLNIDTGEKYPSVRDAADVFGLNIGHVIKAINRGHRCHGAKLRYIDPPRPLVEDEGAAHEIKVLEVLANGALSLPQIAQETGLDSKLTLAALNRQRGICVRKFSNDKGIFWELQTPPNTEEVDAFTSHGRRSAPVDYWRRLEHYTAKQLGALSVAFLGGELVAMYPANGLEELQIGQYVKVAKVGQPRAYCAKTSAITTINRDTGGEWISVTTKATGKKKFRLHPGELEAVGRTVALSLDLGEELREAMEPILTATYKANIGRAKQAQIICNATNIPEFIVWLLEAFWNPIVQKDRDTLLDWIDQQHDWAGLNFCQRHRLASGKFLNLRPCLPIIYHPNFPGLL